MPLHTSPTQNPPLINSAIKILLFFIFLFNLSAGLYVPIVAIYLQGNIPEVTMTVLGFSVGIYSIVKSIFQIPIAKKLDTRTGERDDFYILLIGILIAIIYSINFIYINSVAQLYSLQILTGIADACIMASYYAIFSHHIDRDSQGFEWSLFSVGGLTISAAIGASVGGYIATNFGFTTVFALAALFNVIAALTLILLFPYVKNFRHMKDYKKLKVGR